MRTRNKTPFLAAAFASSRNPPAPSATIVVKGTFRLRPGEPVAPLEGLGAQGTLTGDVFADADVERRGVLVAASDFADYKPRAELLVRARCHTPGAKPMTECPVRVTLGPWSKALRVTGRRVWREGLLGATPTDPVPFTEMPLDFEHAFGGPESPENPAGKGLGTPELHNVEAPADVVRSRGDRIAPAGFEPLSPFWPQRRAKVGKEYGKGYQETRAPYFAADFDWSYFNSAPPDQQLEAVRGDEEISFLNMHPSAAMFSARLPALRVRAFLHDDRGHFREVPMVLDTVFADLVREVLVLTWRGVDSVREDDLTDLKTLLVASEPLAAEPASADGYRADLLAFEADPTGFQRRKAELFGPEKNVDGETHAGDGASPNASRAWKALQDRLGGLPAGPRERLRVALARNSTVPVQGRSLDDTLADALDAPPAAASAPIAFPRKPGALPYVPLGHRLRPIREMAERARQQVARPDIAPRVKDKKATETALAEIQAIENDPVVRSLDPYSFRPGGPGKDEPGPGADLSGQDLSGKDLSGKDLSGANLEGALLMRANLQNANLRGARMKHAVLHEADLAGADLTGADLTQANLSAAKAAKAVLSGANVDQAMFERATLAGADLSNVSGEYAVFSKADLTGAVLRGAKLTKGFFDAADLSRADASTSTLTACRFTDAKAEAASFTAAVLDRSSFERASLKEALFVEARGDRPAFRYATLEGADLRHAVFKDAFFDDARAAGAKLFAASLRGARFYRASLVRADVSKADLLGADLRKADLVGASFAGSNLFQARLRLARRDGCDFAGANLTRTVTDGRSPPER